MSESLHPSPLRLTDSTQTLSIYLHHPITSVGAGLKLTPRLTWAEHQRLVKDFVEGTPLLCQDWENGTWTTLSSWTQPRTPFLLPTPMPHNTYLVDVFL